MTCPEQFEKNSLVHSHLWDDWPNRLKIVNFAKLVLPLQQGCAKCGRRPEEMLQDFEAYNRAR